jgi:hypothetical protein
MYNSFEVKTRKPKDKNKEVKCTTAINNFKRNSKK